MEIRPRPARCGIAPVDSRTIGRVLLYEELELVGVVRVNWLQIGCPFCPSEVNLPAAMADTEVTCDGCAKTYLVPTPAAPVLAAAGPLVPLAILRVPAMTYSSGSKSGKRRWCKTPTKSRKTNALMAGPIFSCEHHNSMTASQ